MKQLLLAQLCVLLVWHAHAINPAPLRSVKPQPQYGTVMPSQDFISDMCRVMDDALQLVPWPLRVDGICDNLSINNPDISDAICPMLDLVKMLLGNLQSMYPMQCAPEGISPPSNTDSAGKIIASPTPLPSQLTERGLPARFPPAMASMLLQAEGPTYHWMFTHVMRLMAWSPCGVLGQETPYTPHEGWDLLGLLSAPSDLRAYGIKQASMPYVAVKRRTSTPATKASCIAALKAHPQFAQLRVSARLQRMSRTLCAGDEIVVLVRGTASASDWLIDLDYNMSPNPAYGEGLIHNGFQRVADTLWAEGLQDILDQHGASASSVTFAGHSMGSAIAALLAARTQKYFAAAPAAKRRTLAAPQLTAILLATPNVGDTTFINDYNSRVNTRNIEFTNDIVTQVPCVGSMVQCTEERGAAGAKSGNITVKALSYARLGGVISFGPSDMPVQADAWSQLSVYTQDDFCNNMMSMGNLFEATHLCSYMCALSSASSTSDSGNWCMLWAQEGIKQTGSGSYCMTGFSYISEHADFPTSPQFPSIKDQNFLRHLPMRKGPQNREKRAAHNKAGRAGKP